jgi:hypothetical protein
MRRHVGELARAVPGRRDHSSVAHHDRADRDFAARAGGLGFGKRQVHERNPAGVGCHHSSILHGDLTHEGASL